MIEKVQTTWRSSFSPPVFGGLLQRKCACGNHSAEGECDECKREKDSLQRKSACGTAFVIPASARDVLASPGQPLDNGTDYAADAQPSAYGRGTTDRDKRVGATTLRFHEGSHGLDFLQFIHDHPYPAFTGRVGVTVQAFNAAVAAYDQALRAFDQQMQDFTDAQTHCIGITIDEYNRQHHIQARRQCR